MFESRARLAGDVRGLLRAVRQAAEGRYACVLDPTRVLFEDPPAGEEPEAIRGFLESRAAALFALPGKLAEDAPMEDAFAGWEADQFLLAFVNGRVAVAVACADAEEAKEQAARPLRALADRLLRYDHAYRLDAQGRGLFFGRARIDLIVVGPPE
jgi:hypothetical protein